MGQRVRMRKNRSKSKGVAIKRTGMSFGSNTVTVGNMTIRGSGNRNNVKKRKVAAKRKKT